MAGPLRRGIALADERLNCWTATRTRWVERCMFEFNRGNIAAARGWTQKLIDQVRKMPSVEHFRMVCALYRQGGRGDIAMAIKSTQLAKDNAHILHTLACLYAEVGKTKEARDLLLRSMDDLYLTSRTTTIGMPSPHRRAIRRSAKSPSPTIASCKSHRKNGIASPPGASRKCG